jgi:periplasmic protein TonB
MSAASTLQSPSPNAALWRLAIAAAFALHLGAAAVVLVVMRGELEDEASGAPAIELSVELAAPRDIDDPEAPPGPATIESVAATSSVASSAAKTPDDDKLTRTESEDAELVRTHKVERPIEDQRSQQAQQVVSAESTASEATAPPKFETPRIADMSTAPAQGLDAAARAATLAWQRALIAHLDRAKRYPAGARQSAEVSVSFTLDRRGHIVSYALRRSSGQSNFDEAALALMKRADPVPPPPPLMADEGLSFEVPIKFRAGRK